MFRVHGLEYSVLLYPLCVGFGIAYSVSMAMREPQRRDKQSGRFPRSFLCVLQTSKYFLAFWGITADKKLRPTRIRDNKMKKMLLVFSVLTMAFNAHGQNGSGYTRGSGWLLRPETGFFLNFGRQFTPNLSVSAGPGFTLYANELTKINGGLSLNADVRYYFLDKKVSPMVTLRAGTISFSYFIGQVLAGVALKDWVLQAGWIFTPGMYTSGSVSFAIGYNFRFYPHK